MIRKAALLSAAFAALALGACSGQDAAEPAETSAAAPTPAAQETAGRGDFIRPGLWILTAESTSGEEGSNVTRECLTPEDVDIRTTLKQLAGGENCGQTKQEVGGGRFDIQTQCRMEGGSSESRLTGRYTPTTLDYDMTMAFDVGGQKVSSSHKVKGRHESPTCPAEDA